MRARASPTLSDSFSFPFRPFAHLRCSLPLLRGFPEAYHTFHLLLSPPIAIVFSLSPTVSLSAFSYFRRPLSFPRFPRAQPRYRTVASVPSYLISDRRRSHARRTACVPWEPFAPLFPRTVRTLSRSLHCSSHSIVVTLYCSLVTVTPPNSI